MLHGQENASVLPELSIPPTFRLEDRRRSPRHIVGGSVTAIRRGGGAMRVDEPICSLTLSNMSESGVAAVSEIPLSTGERVSLYVPSHGGEGGAEMHGQVVRCEKRPAIDGGGFAVAIRLERVAAAA